MKFKVLLLVVLVVFTAGVFIAAKASKSLGKQMWSPRVFAWRNPLRPPPQIDLRPDSPLIISNPRYYSFMSIGSGVGGVLRFVITNRSNKPIHSYQCRYYSSISVGNGAYGSQPEKALLPAQSREDSISAHEYAPLTLTIDFIQFEDGTTWLSNSPHSAVTAEGLEAGAKSAASYLLAVMTRDGVGTVLATLPRIHAEVREPNRLAANPERERAFGLFGFYAGVTNMAVRVENGFKNGGAKTVENVLRSYQE